MKKITEKYMYVCNDNPAAVVYLTVQIILLRTGSWSSLSSNPMHVITLKNPLFQMSWAGLLSPIKILSEEPKGARHFLSKKTEIWTCLRIAKRGIHLKQTEANVAKEGRLLESSEATIKESRRCFLDEPYRPALCALNNSLGNSFHVKGSAIWRKVLWPRPATDE